LSERVVVDDLRDFGLTEKECEVYILLAKQGAKRVKDLCETLEICKAHMYGLLGNLHNRGLVEQSLEHPARYSAMPFDQFLAMQVTTKKEETKHLQERFDEMLAHWNSIDPQGSSSMASERFQIISGRAPSISRILRMIEEAVKEVWLFTTSFGTIRLVSSGIAEAVFRKAGKNREVRFRLLTDMSPENYYVVKENRLRVSQKRLNMESRHIELESSFFPNFILKDREEAIIILTPIDSPFGNNLKHAILWTKSKSITSIFETLYKIIWSHATVEEERLNELTSGQPATRMTTISDAQ
jgi:sugar-specific transcriptional regulator TrmB